MSENTNVRENWKRIFLIPGQTISIAEFDEISNEIMEAGGHDDDLLGQEGIPAIKILSGEVTSQDNRVIRNDRSYLLTGSKKTRSIFEDMGIEGIRSIHLPVLWLTHE